MASRPRNAPAERSCVRSCAGIPPISMTLETLPFSAKRSAAATTITYPRPLRRSGVTPAGTIPSTTGGGYR